MVYELPSNAEADRVGRDFATYLASGTGAIQYPRDAQFVLRRGADLVFFPWSPTPRRGPRGKPTTGGVRPRGDEIAGARPARELGVWE